MKYFKDDKNTVFAFEADGSQDAYIPECLIQITEAEADQLRAPPPEPQEQAFARAIADIRKQRAPILDTLAGIGFDALMAGDTETAQAVSTARAGLKNITALPALIQAATYEDMKVAVLAEYRTIAANAPVAVQKAFVEIVAP